MKRLFTALAVALLLALTASAQVAVSPMPNAKPQLFTNGGVPCAACTLSSYAGGTTTPLATYTDSTGTVTNPTTITLNSAGYPSNQIWLGPSTYKLVLKDALGSTIWTVDNLQSPGLFITSNPNTWTAAQTFCIQNGLIFVGNSCYATLASGLAALPSGGGTVNVPPNYAETLAANVTINKINTSIVFLGPAVLTMGTNQIIVTAGTHNVSIVGPFPWGGYPGPVLPGVTFDYRGTGFAIQIGDGSTLTLNTRVENIYFSLGQAGVNSGAIRADYVQQFSIRYPGINGSTTNQQVGILLNGPIGGAFTGGGEILLPHIVMQAAGSVAIRYASLGAGAVNHVALRGAVLGGANVADKAIDIVAGNSSGANYGDFIDAEGWQVAGINFGASTNANEFHAHFEANATNKDVVFALGVSNNVVYGDHAEAHIQSTDNSGNLTNKIWSLTDLLHGVLTVHQGMTETNYLPSIPGYQPGNLYHTMDGSTGHAVGFVFGKSGGAGVIYEGLDAFTGGNGLNYEILSAGGKGLSIASTNGAATFTSTVATAGQIQSTLATGTAPLSVASTTNVPNLNASSLNGATFAAPGAIGGGTPSTGAFTALTIGAATVPTVTTPTVGQAACIKAAGPPVVIGYCSNVVGAGGACTCN